MGGIGKDFGSMNMDELLKSIYSAEENNITVTSTNGGGGQDGTAGRWIFAASGLVNSASDS